MTKVKIFLILLVVAFSGVPIPLANNINNVYSGGPERDYDERYEDVPSANECWYDGYADGKDHPIDHDRNRECKDKWNYDNLLVLTEHFWIHSSTLPVP